MVRRGDHGEVPLSEPLLSDAADALGLGKREADTVRETLHDDPFVSDEDFGRLVEEADEADRVREDLGASS